MTFEQRPGGSRKGEATALGAQRAVARQGEGAECWRGGQVRLVQSRGGDLVHPWGAEVTLLQAGPSGGAGMGSREMGGGTQRV